MEPFHIPTEVGALVMIAIILTMHVDVVVVSDGGGDVP